MEIFKDKISVNNRVHKLCEEEKRNYYVRQNFNCNKFSKLFLDVCLYKIINQAVLAIQAVEEIIQFIPSQQLQQREQDIIEQYGTLSLEAIKLDIEHEIQLKDKVFQIHLDQLERKESDVRENIFVIENNDIYSLKFFDHLLNVDENTTFIVKNCFNLTFDEVSSKIRNLVIEDTQIDSFVGIQNMIQLNNLQINRLVIKQDTELDLNMNNKLFVLDLSANKFENCKYIYFPDSLKILNLSFNNLTNLYSLYLVNFVEIDLRNNQLQDIYQISKIHSLVKLNLLWCPSQL
ncbi:Leucine-rich_repeat domain superfamily [Hexamita inflata]|uniref:Leucine-rich repeat domain superfamily n=1 Tax=Hexamita inflata TaxID=28002 RepID=A0AA86PEN5_9EUKA|nr:Leucine-rich repeat domain superfamily [Hexamita inflata]